MLLTRVFLHFNKILDIDSVVLDQGSWNIHDVTLVLKTFFAELPDSLFPKAMYHSFMDAGRKFY